jgi:hypothetical protein
MEKKYLKENNDKAGTGSFSKAAPCFNAITIAGHSEVLFLSNTYQKKALCLQAIY